MEDIDLQQVGQIYDKKKNPQSGRVYSPEGLCPSLDTIPCHNNNRLWNGLRIRKLTPRECFRCMDFSDESYDKIKDEFSDTRLYKMAGNSIVVNVLEEIFEELFKVVDFEDKENNNTGANFVPSKMKKEGN